MANRKRRTHLPHPGLPRHGGVGEDQAGQTETLSLKEALANAMGASFISECGKDPWDMWKTKNWDLS